MQPRCSRCEGWGSFMSDEQLEGFALAWAGLGGTTLEAHGQRAHLRQGSQGLVEAAGHIPRAGPARVLPDLLWGLPPLRGHLSYFKFSPLI